MSRQRRRPGQLLSASDNAQPFEPLSFHEAPATTLVGRLSYCVRELLHIARHTLYVLIYGVGYDMDNERASGQQGHQHQGLESLEHRQEQKQQTQPQGDTLLLGRIRNTYQLCWHPGSPTVTLCGDVVAGEQDSFAHAVAAYTHLNLDSSSTAEHSGSRIIRYTGPSALAIPTFEYAPYGSLQAFLLTAPSYPSLSHPSIPSSAAQSALPFHWLLNFASAISFLHSHGVAHRALALNLLWLRDDFSTALFDLSCSVFTTHDDEWDEYVPVTGDLPSWGSFTFPVDDMDSVLYSCATPEDAMALGKAMDVFDFGTVAWRLLTRTVEGVPEWKKPKREDGEREWSIPELQRRLREAIDLADKGGRYEPPGMDLVRKCWALEYRDGGEVLEALRRVVLEMGLRVQRSDEIEGVAQAVDEFKRDYEPKSYLGGEVRSERGYD